MHDLFIEGDKSLNKLIGDTVSVLPFAFMDIEDPIALWDAIGGPEPTILCFINVLPEAFLEG